MILLSELQIYGLIVELIEPIPNTVNTVKTVNTFNTFNGSSIISVFAGVCEVPHVLHADVHSERRRGHAAT